jgi:hypothetical protein
VLDSKSLLHIPPPDPVLGVGLLCNLISLQEAHHMPLRSNLAFKSEFPTCSICNEPVELETTKSNEIGEPMHEECYALEISLGKATRPPPEAREEDPRRIDDPLTGTIIESLHSASRSSATDHCSDCGSDLEYRDCTFFYEGQTWEIPLPICVKCYPTAEVPTDDA